MAGRTGTSCDRPVTDRALRTLVGYNLKRAYNRLHADLMATLAPFGLRVMTYSALVMVRENPGLRPSQLAEALSIERANLVAIVEELARNGWLERRPNLADRRTHALHLTAEGAALCRRAGSAVGAHDRRMTEALAPEQRDVLIAMLARIETLPETCP